MLQLFEEKAEKAKSEGRFAGQTGQSPYDSAGAPRELMMIGPSVVVKGEVSGEEALHIEGTIEGKISIPRHRVSIGKRGKVTADIEAAEVVVMGTVQGNIRCAGAAEVRHEASITGDICARRIRIEEGAVVKGRVEVQAGARDEKQESKPPDSRPSEPASVKAPMAEAAAPPEKAAAAAAGGEAKRLSSVLLEPRK